MEAFKIRDKDGKFSTGGLYPRWTTRGRTWGSMRALKLHLRYFCHDCKWDTESGKIIRGWWNDIPKEWKVVELTEKGIKEYSAKGLYPLTTGEKL